MSGDWDNTWIRIHSVPGFELVTVDVMRGNQIWVRNQIDGSDDIPSQLWEIVSHYWDAICDSNSDLALALREINQQGETQ